MADNKEDIPEAVPVMSVAQPVNGGNQGVALLPTAVPISYEVPNVADPQFTNYNESDIRVAPSLHQYNDDSAEAQVREEGRQARLGTRIGAINARQERRDIQNANRLASEQPKLEKMRIINGRDKARTRVAEGFDVREDKYFNKESYVQNAMEKKMKEQDEDLKKQLSGGSGGGYDVQEYEVAEYTGAEFSDTYEYKSVYD